MKFKNLFSTPKKIATTVGVSFLALGVLGTVSFISVFAIAENNSIGKEAAVKNAYAAAGISSDDVDAVDAKFKFDDGKFVYDIEFYSDGKEYEYKIHSKNGSVVEFEHPKHHSLPKDSISIDDAKTIVLNHAGLTSEDVTFTKAKLDRDDSFFEYELEFNTSEKKYKYEISATDGTIINANIDSSFLSSSQINQENLISIETAKEKVLSHASVNDAVFTKSKLEREEGNYYYNLHFVSENTEYQYTVDASNGEILKSSSKNVNSSANITISVEDAKNVALSHAQLSSENARFIKSELDEEDGLYIYEIEFSFENKKYEYEINAHTSAIVKSKIKNNISSQTLLGIDKAKENVLTHADVSAEKVTFTKAELDEEDGLFIYEINFKSNDFNFEYKLDATSGKVIKSVKTSLNHDTDTKEAISVEDAKNIAFSDAEISSSHHPHSFKEEFEDGKKFFEIEFSSDKGIFKYEIDSQSGEIIEKEFVPTKKPSPNEKLIGIEAAKEKALEKFSINKENATFTKAKLEKDNGNVEYDIEFIYNGKKYDVSLNAANGEIHEFEIN